MQKLPPSQIFKFETTPFNLSWSKWITHWWHWCFSDPFVPSPAEDPDGHITNVNQKDSNVFFLAGTFGGEAKRTCTTDKSKAVFFPIVNDLISFAEYPHLESEYELRQYAKSDLDTTSHLEARVDSQETDLDDIHRCQSSIMNLFLPVQIETGIVAKETVAVSDGYWVFLKKLPKGIHEIYIRGEKKLFDEVQHVGYMGENGLFVNEVKYTVAVD